jgi:hypothetical protein
MKIRLVLPYALFALLCTLPLGQRVWGQAFGHEWINFNQQYWKIPTTETGIYQISRNDLLAAGFPVAAVDPRRIQLFHRGQEQALFISGEGNAVFDPGDFIQFYGQRNDGTLDAELYQPASAMPHPHYNLYSDTTAYFLTWRLDNGFGNRMASFYEAPGAPSLTLLPGRKTYRTDKLITRTAGASDTIPGPRDEVNYGGKNLSTWGKEWTDALVPTGRQQRTNRFECQQCRPTGPKPVLEW